MTDAPAWVAHLRGYLTEHLGHDDWTITVDDGVAHVETGDDHLGNELYGARFVVAKREGGVVVHGYDGAADFASDVEEGTA